MKPLKEKVIFAEGRSFLTYRRPEFKYDFYWHIHPEFEIVYILKGKGVRYVGNSVEEYSAPELVFIPPGIPHTWQSDAESQENDAYVLHFTDECFGEKWYTQSEFSVLQGLMTSTAASIIKDCQESEKLFEKTVNRQSLSRVSAFIELLDYINRVESRSLGSYNVEGETQNPLLEKIITWLNENFTSEFTVIDLADKMSMSPYQLRSTFKKHTKKSILQYTNELRVFEACRLMQNQQYTISYLSSLAGFNNLSYFNRTFLKVTGMTPREYRKVFCG